jgi:hypothetical protein
VLKGGDLVSELNLMTGKYNMDMMKSNYEDFIVKKQNLGANEVTTGDEKISDATKVSDDKLTLAGQTKTNYLEMAIGDREKELDKLGLSENEDGKVFMKKIGAENIMEEAKEDDMLQAEDTVEEKKEDKDSMGEECETCANRKYQDGSDEMVSFKSATHISPEAAATAVRAHEGEHVSNAYDKAAKNDGEVVNASVAIHTSVCPECGRTYVSGGTTTTTIRYNKDNYAQNSKSKDAAVVPGKDVDALA